MSELGHLNKAPRPKIHLSFDVTPRGCFSNTPGLHDPNWQANTKYSTKVIWSGISDSHM
jgi:hypothetical protein